MALTRFRFTYRFFFKCVAYFVLITFSANSIGWSQPGGTSIGRNGVTSQNKLLSDLLQIPSELGIVREHHLGNPNQVSASDRLIIHIQDAHSNPEAQRKIKDILKFLRDKLKISFVAVEGAAGRLHPELFNLYPEYPEANQAIVEDLTQKGELNASDLLVLEGGNQVVLRGAEDKALYRENLKTYRSLVFSKKEREAVLQPLKKSIGELEGFYLRDELNKFVKLVESRKKSRNELLSVVSELTKWAKSYAGIDLNDAIEQIRFPNLTRLANLKILEQKIDTEKANQEKNEFLKLIQSKFSKDKKTLALIDRLTKFFKLALDAGAAGNGFTPDEAPRRLFEELYEVSVARKVSFEAFPYLRAHIAYVILASEIEPEPLFGEIENVEEMVLKKLAVSDEEREVLSLARDYQLIEKLFALEWTAKDHHRFQYEREKYSSTALLKRITALKQKAKQGRDELASMAELDKWIERTLGFYEGANKRSRALVENLFAMMSEEKKASAVLVTGGFHSDEIRSLVQKQSANYVVIAPRLNEKIEPSLYEKVLTNQNADTVTPIDIDIGTIPDTDLLMRPEQYRELRGLLPPDGKLPKQQRLGLHGISVGAEVLKQKSIPEATIAAATFRAHQTGLFNGYARAELLNPSTVKISMPDIAPRRIAIGNQKEQRIAGDQRKASLSFPQSVSGNLGNNGSPTKAFGDDKKARAELRGEIGQEAPKLTRTNLGHFARERLASFERNLKLLKLTTLATLATWLYPADWNSVVMLGIVGLDKLA